MVPRNPKGVVGGEKRSLRCAAGAAAAHGRATWATRRLGVSVQAWPMGLWHPPPLLGDISITTRARDASLRQKVIRSMHSGVFGAHRNATATFKELVSRYWWPSLEKDTHDFVRRCAHCELAKGCKPSRQGPCLSRQGAARVRALLRSVEWCSRPTDRSEGSRSLWFAREDSKSPGRPCFSSHPPHIDA